MQGSLWLWVSQAWHKGCAEIAAVMRQTLRGTWIASKSRVASDAGHPAFAPQPGTALTLQVGLSSRGTLLAWRVLRDASISKS